MTTTPFEREILTHHYVSPAPFPRAHAPLYAPTAWRFVELGLLVASSSDDGPTTFDSTPALRLYMERLAAVELPTEAETEVTELRQQVDSLQDKVRELQRALDLSDAEKFRFARLLMEANSIVKAVNHVTSPGAAFVPNSSPNLFSPPGGFNVQSAAVQESQQTGSLQE